MVSGWLLAEWGQQRAREPAPEMVPVPAPAGSGPAACIDVREQQRLLQAVEGMRAVQPARGPDGAVQNMLAAVAERVAPEEAALGAAVSRTSRSTVGAARCEFAAG